MKPENTESKILQEAHILEMCRSLSPGWEHELASWINSDDEWLIRRCTARLGSKADAEDAVQEVTLKVLRAIGQFEGRSSLRTWVTRIADNHCYSTLKQRTAKAMTNHLQYNITLFETDRFNTNTEVSDEQSATQSTLKKLASKNQEILRLRFHHELSLEDIAQSLGISLSATKMRLYRAMDSFKKKHCAETI